MKKPLLHVELIGDQCVVYEAPRGVMSHLRDSLEMEGCELVDARDRTYDKWVALTCALFFVCTGSWLWLPLCYVCARDWVNSYPRREE